MKIITLTTNRYDRGYESADIRVIGSRQARSTTLHYHPENIEPKGFAAREGKLDQWVLFATQHCTVIDNFGGSGAERARMTVELTVGEPFMFDGPGMPDGIWMLADRDQRALEGEGVKPVPYDGQVPGYTSAGAQLLQTMSAECRERGSTTVTERPASGRYEDQTITVRVTAIIDVTLTQRDIEILTASGQSTSNDSLCALAADNVKGLAMDDETDEPLRWLSIKIRDTEVLS